MRLRQLGPIAVHPCQIGQMVPHLLPICTGHTYHVQSASSPSFARLLFASCWRGLGEGGQTCDTSRRTALLARRHPDDLLFPGDSLRRNSGTQFISKWLVRRMREANHDTCRETNIVLPCICELVGKARVQIVDLGWPE